MNNIYFVRIGNFVFTGIPMETRKRQGYQLLPLLVDFLQILINAVRFHKVRRYHAMK